MIEPTAVEIQAANVLRNKLALAVKRAERKLDIFENYPVLFSTTCWASTSGKPVFICWCAQCKEIVNHVDYTGYLPEWLEADYDAQGKVVA